MQSPLAEIPARIGWNARVSDLIYDDPPYFVMQAVPVMPCFRSDLCNQEVVWDPLRLLDSIKRPGAYYLATCTCGYADDAGIKEAVLVSHPDMHTVIWELDIIAYRVALVEPYAEMSSGFIRLVFRREEYEADVRAMMKELQRLGTTVCLAYPETEEFGVKELLRLHDFHFLDSTKITVEELEPKVDGRELEQLLDLDLTAAWESEPLWSAGTVVELGFFSQRDGHEMIRFNGKCSASSWPGWYFTRWSALDAFNSWLSFVNRAFWAYKDSQIPAGMGRNDLVLKQETDRAACHNAGRHLAAVMQSCCNEGDTAPDVTVLYTEAALLCAVSKTDEGHTNEVS